MAFNRHAFSSYTPHVGRRLSDPLTSALVKQSMNSGPIKRPPRIKFTTTPIEEMSVNEIDDLVTARDGAFSPTEWSAIEARRKALGL